MIVELGERVYAVPGGVNIGVVRTPENTAILIDTGINETNGKKVLRAVRDELGLDVAAILTTHAHADHFGANYAVVKRTGAKVYAPAVDEAVLRYPLLQPSLLFAGADPLDTLRTNFLLAHPSPVDVVVEAGPLSVGGVDIDVVGLAGHSMNQVGYMIDGVFFCADVVLPESVLAKYRIPYLFSVTDHRAALKIAEGIECRCAVPGHGPIVESLGELVALNRGLLQRVIDRTLEFCDAAIGAEELLGLLLRDFDAPVSDASSFYLLQPTVYALLSDLQRAGSVVHDVRDGRSMWRAAKRRL